jgi:hypothetical protein
MVDGLRAALKGDGPYLARPAKDDAPEWPHWYVAGSDGRLNVLTFPDKPGAVLTDRETAEAIAHAANGGGPLNVPA